MNTDISMELIKFAPNERGVVATFMFAANGSHSTTEITIQSNGGFDASYEQLQSKAVHLFKFILKSLAENADRLWSD